MNSASVISGISSGLVLSGVEVGVNRADVKKSIGSGAVLAISDVTVDWLQANLPQFTNLFDFLGTQKMNILGAIVATFLIRMLKDRDYPVKSHNMLIQLALCYGSNVGGDVVNPYVNRLMQ